LTYRFAHQLENGLEAARGELILFEIQLYDMASPFYPEAQLGIDSYNQPLLLPTCEWRISRTLVNLGLPDRTTKSTKSVSETSTDLISAMVTSSRKLCTNYTSLQRIKSECLVRRGIINNMEPISTITGAWSIAKTAGEISKKLYELGKGLKDREEKQRVDEILDSVRDLKQIAAELEDENRELREQLRFSSDNYEFRTPFYYENSHPERPLCPKCFAKRIAAPMGEPGQSCTSDYRRCLVCSECVQVNSTIRQASIQPIVRRY
jgi:hypothetical protein